MRLVVFGVVVIPAVLIVTLVALPREPAVIPPNVVGAVGAGGIVVVEIAPAPLRVTTKKH